MDVNFAKTSLSFFNHESIPRDTQTLNDSELELFFAYNRPAIKRPVGPNFIYSSPGFNFTSTEGAATRSYCSTASVSQPNFAGNIRKAEAKSKAIFKNKPCPDFHLANFGRKQHEFSFHAANIPLATASSSSNITKTMLEFGKELPDLSFATHSESTETSQNSKVMWITFSGERRHIYRLLPDLDKESTADRCGDLFRPL